MKKQQALLVVDVQNDFCPGGRLAVSEGDKIVPVLNKYIRLFSKKGLPVLASRDWHPKKTRHFKNFGGAWPIHCVERTKGARFHSRLMLPKSTIIISKGMSAELDGYSAFQAVDSRGRSLSSILDSLGVEELYVGGLATDYCVKASVLSALRAGLKVKLLSDAVKGVNKKDARQAIKEMIVSGAKQTSIRRLNKNIY
ncbi:nicotinamidase [Candidatus Omnitrophota bacterium]